MRIKTLVASLALAATPVYAYATDFTLANNADKSAVARIGIFCSTVIGNDGVILPGQQKTVAQSDIDKVCADKCKIEVYLGTKCTGQSIATAQFNNKEKLGVTSITNHADDYSVTGGGYSASLNKVGVKKWYNIFF